MLETIPTAKQFRDAISSLSDEQQRFAKAYRSLQLESTLFGVAVIQVKPQLEKLLKLPPQSLNKEIALTQQLLELFFTYQVPSDLLSYNGDPSASAPAKVDVVRGFVRKMFDTINGTKQQELVDAREAQEFRLADNSESEGSGSASNYDIDEDRGGMDDYDEEEADESEPVYKSSKKSSNFMSSIAGVLGGVAGFGKSKDSAPMLKNMRMASSGEMDSKKSKSLDIEKSIRADTGVLRGIRADRA